MTICRCPFRALRTTAAGVLMCGVAVLAFAGSAVAGPANSRAKSNSLTTDSLTFAASTLHNCRSHHLGHCRSIKAHLSRLQQTARMAPQVTLSGATISWKSVPGAKGYVLGRKVSSQDYHYSAVNGTSTTPQALPGQTVYYWVRTQTSHSTWSAAITITYPAQGGPSAGTSSITSAATATVSQGGGSSELTPGSAIASTTSNSGTNGPIESSSSQNFPSTNFGEPFVKGVNVQLNGWGEPTQVANEIENLGAGWVRADLAWSSVMPSPGEYDWSSFDEVIKDAQANGLHVLPVLGYAPSWTEPSNAAAYAEFVAAAVARYGPGTQANLKWFELWNEPYCSYAWSGQTPNPEAYARDVRAAAQAAKQIAPSAKLLIAADYQDSAQTGGSSPWQTTWIDDMFSAVPDLGEWIDGVAVHPYGDDPSEPLAERGGWKDAKGQWAFQRIDTIREKFLQHGVNVPFWITEEGWSTWDVSEAEQAHDYADLIIQITKRPWIRALFTYCLREYNAKPTNDEPGYGLLKYGSWQPKTAYYTLQQGFNSLT